LFPPKKRNKKVKAKKLKSRKVRKRERDANNDDSSRQKKTLRGEKKRVVPNSGVGGVM
jgi:hypothetical protein